MSKTAILEGRVREHDVHNESIGISEAAYRDAKKQLPDLQQAVAAIQHKVKQFQATIRDRVGAYSPDNPATRYDLAERDKDSEALAKLQARSQELTVDRDRLHNVIVEYESSAARSQYAGACAQLQEIASAARPEARRAIERLRVLVTSLGELTGLYSSYQRTLDGNLRIARRQLESLGVPAPEQPPEFGVTPSAILQWISARWKLNPNCRATALDIDRAFPGVCGDAVSAGGEEDFE